MQGGDYYNSCTLTDELIECNNKNLYACSGSSFNLHDVPHCANDLKIDRGNGRIRVTSANKFDAPELGMNYRLIEFHGFCVRARVLVPQRDQLARQPRTEEPKGSQY